MSLRAYTICVVLAVFCATSAIYASHVVGATGMVIGAICWVVLAWRAAVTKV